MSGVGERESISMIAAEIEAFLRSRALGVLASIAEDGAPAGDVCTYTYESGTLRCRLAPTAAAASNIARDDRVCVIVEHFPEYYGIKGVVVHGRARAERGEVVVPVDVSQVTSFDFAKIRRRPGAG